jgi:hypothetical protein
MPTIPDVLPVLRAYYALPHRGLGGCVHVILEDSNADQATADACLKDAQAWGDRWGNGALPQDREVAELLAAMSTTQRRKLSAAHSFYPPPVRKFDPTTFNYRSAPCLEALQAHIEMLDGDWETFFPVFVEAMAEVNWQVDHPPES